MINYCQLFSSSHIALLQDWFESTGELFVRLELPHSGGSGFSYQVSSLAELKSLISRQTHPEIAIFIFNKKTLTEEELDERSELPWVYCNADKVIFIAVTKNRNFYEPHKASPAKYEQSISSWFNET
jgi:hypothetical protein